MKFIFSVFMLLSVLSLGFSAHASLVAYEGDNEQTESHVSRPDEMTNAQDCPKCLEALAGLTLNEDSKNREQIVNAALGAASKSKSPKDGVQ